VQKKAQIPGSVREPGGQAAHCLLQGSREAIRLKAIGSATRSDYMKLLVDLLKRVWQRGRPDGYTVRASEGEDRSSMADFVRILQMHDRDSGRSNYPS
jgi:hypothetical protein